MQVKRNGIHYFGPRDPSECGVVVVGEFEDGEEIEGFFDADSQSNTPARLIDEVAEWANDVGATIEEIQCA